MELVKNNSFPTPETSKQLEDFISLMSKNEEDRANLTKAAGMAWNLACETVIKANKAGRIKR